MNKITHLLRLDEIKLAHLVSVGISMLTVEYFLKLGSFSLECICFLGVSYFLFRIIQQVNGFDIKEEH